MSTNNPLNPKGSSFEQAGQRKSNLPVIVLIFLAFHAVVLGGILIVGCKRDDTRQASSPPPQLPPITTTTNDENFFPPIGSLSSNDPIGLPPLPVVETLPLPPTATGPTPLAPPTFNPLTDVPPATVGGIGSAPAPVTDSATKVHVIARGDTFYSIARDYGTTMKEIQAANPNIEPKRIQLGQKVVVPASKPKSVVPAATGTEPGTYKVKSGDYLGKIAKSHGTTVERMREVNGLTTDRIQVGRILKLPPESRN